MPWLLCDITSRSDVTKQEVGPGRDTQQRARRREQARRWRRPLGHRGTVPVSVFSNVLPKQQERSANWG
ncbi:hypothetical protein XELAEV_18001239mg [Xenopus laevis]|nr:hypothetical protein XELAEV_18001239mg [Xenopus laevis]